MDDLLEVKYGMLTLTNIFSSVWLGNWNQYEKIMSELPPQLKSQLPFHIFYDRKDVELWQQNYFDIPGDHFISPYFSTYSMQKEGHQEETNNQLLCLLGIYEQMGFYFPLETGIYPDHIGCLNTFVEYVLREEIKAEKNQDMDYVNQLQKFRKDIIEQYLIPLQVGIQKGAINKIQNSFLNEFLAYYCEFMERDAAIYTNNETIELHRKN